MRFFKVLGLLFLSFIVLILGWIHMSLSGIQATLFSPSYYAEVISESNLISNVFKSNEDLLSNIILGNTNEINTENNEGDISKGLSADERQQMKAILSFSEGILKDGYSSDWIDEIFNLAMGDFLGFITSGEMDLLSGIQSEEQNQKIIDRIMEEISAMPTEELEKLGLDLNTAEILAQDMFNTINISNQISLGDFGIGRENFILRGATNIGLKFQEQRIFYMTTIYIFLALVLLLMCVIGGWLNGFKWFGIVSVISAGTFLILIRLITKLLNMGIGNFRFLDVSNLDFIINETVKRISITPYFFIAIGIIVTGIGFLYPAKNTSGKVSA